MAENRNVGLDVKVLEDKEVLFNFGDTPVIDRSTGTFMEGWHSGGLEPADSTWDENREVSSTATNLTGGQTANSYTAGAVTSTVNLIPGSPTLDFIEWPETVEQAGVLYRKHSSKIAKAYVARVHKFASGIVGIKVSREKADLSVPARPVAKDPAGRAVTINYNNGDDEFMFEEMFYLVGEDGTVVQVEEKIFKDVTDLQTKLDSGEAFVPKASAAGMSAMVPVAEVEDGAQLVGFLDPDGDTATQPDAPEGP